jgi:competence protein ComEC
MVWVAAALASASALDRLVAVSVAVWILGTASFLFAWLTLNYQRRDRAAAVALLLAIGCFGGLYHHGRWSIVPPDDIAKRITNESQPVVLEGLALGRARVIPAPPPDPFSSVEQGPRSRLELDVTAIRDGQVWQPASGRIHLTIDGIVLTVRYGDKIRVLGDLLARPIPLNPGEPDRAMIERSEDRSGAVACRSPDSISIVESGTHGSLEFWLDETRHACRETLASALTPETLGIGQALLLGGYELLSEDNRDVFVSTGVMHLLCISGLHVGIVAGGFMMAIALGWLPRRLGWALVGLVVLAFLVLTEGRAPVIRATTLVLLFAGAELLWRRRSSANALALAGIVCWLVAPGDLFRLGPQLSFLAVATFMVLGRWILRPPLPEDPLDRLIYQSRPWPVRWLRTAGRWFWLAMLTGLVVNLVTQPLVAWQFHLITPVAIPLSLLLTPLVAVAMMSGLVLLLTGGWFPVVGTLAAWLCQVSLTWILGIVDWTADLPGSHVWVTGPTLWWLIGLYAGLTVWVSGVIPDIPCGRWLALLAIWVGLGAASGLRRNDLSEANRQSLHCTFLAVGHGGAAVLELPDGRVLLYDCGRLGPGQRAAETTSRFLWSRGRTHIDALVISHPDLDHFNGVPGLLKRVSVGIVYLSPRFAESDSPSVAALFECFADHGVKVRTINEGHFLTSQDYQLSVLGPPGDGVSGSDNANSVVVLVESRGHRILLTGDLENEGLAHVLSRPPIAVDVLQVPHHGSSESDPQAVAAWSTPRVAVISRGQTPLSGETRAALRTAGAMMLVTATSGAVEVAIRSDVVELSSFLQGSLARWSEKPGSMAPQSSTRP